MQFIIVEIDIKLLRCFHKLNLSCNSDKYRDKSRFIFHICLKSSVMELIRTLTQMVHSLRARGIRRRVAVVCPKDSHTEYVIIRALREEIAEFLLVSDTADMEMAYHLRMASPDFVRVYEAETPDAAAGIGCGAGADRRSRYSDERSDQYRQSFNVLFLNKEKGLLPSGGVLSHVAVARFLCIINCCFFRMQPLSLVLHLTSFGR